MKEGHDAQPDPLHSAGSGAPSFVLPQRACDCHMHVFDQAFPFAPGALIRPPDASLEAYRVLQRRLGLQRHVVVQPSSYGTDNRLLLQALAEQGECARGVAVIDDHSEPAELNRLVAAGVQGVRFNLVQRGATTLSMLPTVARRIQPLGWHVQLHITPGDIVRNEDAIAELRVPVVIDHMARYASEPGLELQVRACVTRLLAAGGTWLKLSGAYLASRVGPPDYGDLEDFVQALARDFPERLVWGTDWPHTTEASKPDDALLADLLLRWLPDPAVREQVLVRNPAALYGFAS